MIFHVQNHWLYKDQKPVTKIESGEQKYSPGQNICDYIIYHYTASSTAQSAHNNYLNPNSQVSWHLTIDLDGSIYQLLDFRKRAWHAGTSNWIRPDGVPTGGLNKWAIGIEMVNPGPLSFDGRDYKTWFGATVPNDKVFRDNTGKFWYKYSDIQLKTVIELSKAVIKQYKCIDVMGHEDISPGRKQDPGRAFDSTMLQIKSLL